MSPRFDRRRDQGQGSGAAGSRVRVVLAARFPWRRRATLRPARRMARPLRRWQRAVLGRAAPARPERGERGIAPVRAERPGLSAVLMPPPWGRALWARRSDRPRLERGRFDRPRFDRPRLMAAAGSGAAAQRPP